MHISNIKIQDIPPFTEPVALRFDRRVNLFIGPNACGKSTILRLIKRAHSPSPGVDDDPIFDLGVSDDWPINEPEMNDGAPPHRVPIWNKVPLLYIPSTRVNIPLNCTGGQADIEPKSVNTQYTLETLLTEGVNTDHPLVNLFQTDTGVFYGHYVESAIAWLLRDYFYGIRGMQNSLQEALNRGYSCAKTICSEVIYNNVPQAYIELKDDGIHLAERIIHYGMGVGTSDEVLGEPLYAGVLSSGTQGTLLWVWALVLKLIAYNDWIAWRSYGEASWEKQPGILLIDEIENHLHPTWQRRVIPALLEHFPGLQIFATTHSPFVVAGLKAGQVHLLKRDEHGDVTATTNTEDVIGWTADEILRTMMSVEDPTDDETAAAARELRQLRNEGQRSTDEAEERRQQQIQELRQRVNKDLLAGGPMAARRELFEQQFAEALGKYRQSQNLDQENG